MDYADLKTSGFSCRIGGNGAEGEHRPGYNGVWSLVPAGAGESLFVPAYAGLNLEHYFDGWHNGRREIFFEPRVAPMRVERPSRQTVRLVQEATPFWGVASVTEFSVAEPGSIEMDFRCIPTRPIFNRDTMGVFWASYIRRPEDNAIHFRGCSPGGQPEWVRFASPRHGEASSVRGPGDDVELMISEGMRGTLMSSIAPLRWERPYFYGRWRDWCWLVQFHTAERLRFAMSPSGGGEGNPAWDFQFLAPAVRPGRQYRLRARLTVEPWRSRERVDELAAQWGVG